MDTLFEQLKAAFIANSNFDRAEAMSKYMRNKFVYFGISSPIRKNIQSNFFPLAKTFSKKEMKDFILQAWSQDQREWKYIAMDFAQKFIKMGDLEFLELFESLVKDQSWWDTVDCLAANLLGKLLKPNPELAETKMLEWIESEDFWVQRTAIILQLSYKEKTDFELLKKLILKVASSKEFFLQKASGWALRQYSKTQPSAVLNFVHSNQLAPLTTREAQRLIIKHTK